MTTETELGPLPKTDHTLASGGSLTRMPAWSEEQMRAYAAAEVAKAVARERERLCAAIKAADDKAVDEASYMLDSNDCISVIRGTWGPHE